MLQSEEENKRDKLGETGTTGRRLSGRSSTLKNKQKKGMEGVKVGTTQQTIRLEGRKAKKKKTSQIRECGTNKKKKKSGEG